MVRLRNRDTKYHINDKNLYGWTITDIIKSDNGKCYYDILCPCGCGQIDRVRTDGYKNYKKMCNYQKSLIPPKHIPRESYKTRLIGKQFGLLKVIEFAGYNKYNQILYKCECQCENKTIVYVTYSDLISGKKDHCGCLTKERLSLSKKKYNTYDLSGEYGIGYAYNTGKEFYFDLEDYDLIKDYCWYEHKREDEKDGYICAKIVGENKQVRLHRLVMGVTYTKIKIDHIKHKLYDNRKSQLRISSNQENTMNHVLHSDNTTGVSGVTFDKEKSLYRARIYYKWKTFHLGYYKTLEEATKARKEAEEKYFKEWSYDNSMKYGGNNEN